MVDVFLQGVKTTNIQWKKNHSLLFLILNKHKHLIIKPWVILTKVYYKLYTKKTLKNPTCGKWASDDPFKIEPMMQMVNIYISLCLI